MAAYNNQPITFIGEMPLSPFLPKNNRSHPIGNGDYQDLNATIKGSRFVASSSTIAAATTITSPIVPYNNQHITSRGEIPLSQFPCENNISQTYGNNNYWDLNAMVKGFHFMVAASSSVVATTTTTDIPTPIVPMEAYSNKHITFKGKMSLPSFLSNNNIYQTIGNNNYCDLNEMVNGLHSVVVASSSALATVGTCTTIPIEPLDASNQTNSIFQENSDLLQPSCKDITEELLNDPYDTINFSDLQNPASFSQSSSNSPRFIPKGSEDLPHQHLQQQQSVSLSKCTITQAKTKQFKKRKNQMKRIYQVPFVEGLSRRYWRKYGEKPIKGSPYPRGYYRCTAFKGCMARKRIERNKSNPSMLIVTYTDNHNHPMPPYENFSIDNNTIGLGNDKNNRKKSTSSPSISSTTNLSAEKKIAENESEDTDDEYVSDVVMIDDVFEGLDDLVDLPVEESISKEHMEVSTCMRTPPLDNVVVVENGL